MKHELDAVAAQQRVADSHIPTPERKEERPAMTDDKDVSALTLVGAGAAPSAIEDARALLKLALEIVEMDGGYCEMTRLMELAARAFIKEHEARAWRPIETIPMGVEVLLSCDLYWDKGKLYSWRSQSPTFFGSNGAEHWHQKWTHWMHKPAMPTDGALPEPSKGQAPPSSSKVTI